MSNGIKITIYIISTMILAFIIFKPVIFPRCACCGKIKVRSRFTYITHNGMRLTHKGQLCVCKKCCQKYNIRSIADFKKKNEIKKRIEYKNRYI